MESPVPRKGSGTLSFFLFSKLGNFTIKNDSKAYSNH